MAKDMKACIKDFLKHVDTLEGEEDPDGCGINHEYRLIQELQNKNRRENVFTSDAAKRNLPKNRYKDIVPYDDHRVILTEKDGEEGSDYINASLIQGLKGSGGYIASQGPLAATVNDYWRMIWEKEAEVVFMACRIVEMGKIKCKQYWNNMGESDDFGDINVYTESEENISSDFIRRVLTVTRGEDKRTVTQYHYSGWPDHGIPDDPDHIRDLIAIMRQTRTKVEKPLVVHCSAGCGRTGAIIAIDHVWTLLEEGKFDESFSLYELICKLREQRMSMVQTADQYALVYNVLKSLCEDWLVRMASHTYVNVELENPYDNIGEHESQQEDHIYEDSTSLKENFNKLKFSPTPKSPPTSPTTRASNDNTYSNVEISNGQPQLQRGISSSTSATANNDEEVLHRTVIQIGTAAMKKTTAPPPPSSSTNPTAAATSATTRGKKEVVNLIQSDSLHPRPTIAKSVSVPGTSSSTDHNPTRADNKKAFSLHDKPTTDPSRLVQVPANPPGFADRMPRVRGPVPEPPHWNQS